MAKTKAHCPASSMLALTEDNRTLPPTSTPYSIVAVSGGGAPTLSARVGIGRQLVKLSLALSCKGVAH